MSRVTGYAWEAGVHCIDCTRQAVEDGRLKIHDNMACDANGIQYNATDSKGNTIDAMFDTDEHPAEGEYCEDCGEAVAEPYEEEDSMDSVPSGYGVSIGHGEGKTLYYAMYCPEMEDGDWEVIGTFDTLFAAQECNIAHKRDNR